MPWIIRFTITVLIFICVTGCSSGTPLEAVDEFAYAICSGDLEGANKHFVFEERLDSEDLDEMRRFWNTTFSWVPGGSSIMIHLYNNSTFDEIEHSTATARINWKVNIAQTIKDMVAAYGVDSDRIPESALPGEMTVMTLILEKRGGKWRIKDYIAEDRYLDF